MPPLQNKRKAEDDIIEPNSKAIKTSSISYPSHLTDTTRINGSNGGGAQKPSTIPYRGTAKATSSSAPATPTGESTKQHKKGSYQEIMARARAEKAQVKPVVGTISHKPKEKTEMTRKKELKLKKKTLREKKLGKGQNDSRTSSSEGQRDRKAGLGSKIKDKKTPQPTYTGTAKPVPKPQPAYKGTMGSRATSAKSIEKPKPRRNANEYAGTDDELDSYGEDEDDGDGHSEEESDDMEAGFSDVEQEETVALKVARKEDDEELQRENALKKVKEDRRKRLEALSKNAKPQRY